MSPVRRPARVGVVDSGINARHRQIGDVAGGIGVRVRDGAVETDDAWNDLIGHGTAVAATIRGHAPQARLYSIRIFRRRLLAHLDALLFAIDWAVSKDLDLLNLSLGCESARREAELAAACSRAAGAGVRIVTAATEDGRAIPGVVRVAADPELEEDEVRVEDEGELVYASPWARSLGELPRDRNVHGGSLAVAHVTGILAERLGAGRLVPAASPVESLRTAV